MKEIIYFILLNEMLTNEHTFILFIAKAFSKYTLSCFTKDYLQPNDLYFPSSV